MLEELDTQDALDPESEQDTTPENETPDYSEFQEKITKTEELAKNQKIRAEKAEAELKKLKAESAKKDSKEETSNEPDYAKLAFLEGKGIKHPDDQKIVQDEAKRLKLPLTDILQMEHMKAKLKNAKYQREAEAGMPDGSGQPSKGSKSSVDYWVDKKDKDGNYVSPPPELGYEFAASVVNARMKQSRKSKMFADDMF